MFIGLSISAQISELDYIELRRELSQKINQLRNSKGLKPLESNIILRKAAKNQSVYMAENKKLGHSQLKFELGSPKKRVKYFKGFEFVLVGENVLHTSRIRLPLNKKKLESIADEMFLSWKNSSGHYANMVKPEYEFGDIDFQYDSGKQVIYATHVFGKRGIQIKGQLSNNAFGLIEDEDDCYSEYGSIDNILANMGNDISIEGNKVMFYYHSFYYFNQIFSSNNDGIAIDLVFRDQLSCGSPNQIDYSPIYDGILLKPVYKDEILRNNIAKSKYRIIAQIGTIPDSLMSRAFSCSIVLIKNGKKCKYLIPGDVPSKRYQLRPIKPRLKNLKNIRLEKSGIIETHELIYDFETNITTPIEYPTIKENSNSIHSIEILSFSSVEGDARKNEVLHNQRAQAIKRHLLQELKNQNPKITIDAKENWDKMYFQLRYFLADDLAVLPKETLKNIIASKDDRLPWDSLLFNQRKSIAIIHYEGTAIDASDKDKILKMNFKTAVLNKNFNLANKALFEMYYAETFSSEFLYEEAIFKTIIQYPELTQNVAALLSKSYKNNLSKTIEFLFNWLNKEKEISKESKYNLLHLYTLLSSDLLNSWDISAKRLSNVIHPTIVENLIEDDFDSELMLNLNLTFIRYFGQINDRPNTTKAFDFIVDYFSARTLNIEDEIDLALFYNDWSRYDLTNKNLLIRFNEGELNERGVFILLKTLNFYKKDNEGISWYEDIYLKALELNPQRWCTWVREEFQILRDEEIKNLYCDKCEKN